MSHVVYATNYDDWQALYVDGECVEQGHRLTPDDVLRLLLGKTVDSFEKIEIEPEEEFPDSYPPAPSEE